MPLMEDFPMNSTHAMNGPQAMNSPQPMNDIRIRRELSPAIRRLAIVVREDSLDRLLTPLSFAWELGRQGVRVDILFVHWAVRVLTKEGVRSADAASGDAPRAEWLRERLARAGDPVRIHDYLKLLRATGQVRIHACRVDAARFGVRPEDLLPEVESIIDPRRFLQHIALRADLVQHF
jgi:peroxiredoxin family protein